MNIEAATPSGVWGTWTNLAARYINCGDRRIANAAAEFSDALKAAHIGLWRGEKGLGMTDRETDSVLTTLEAKRPRAQRRLIQNIFRRGLTRGNKSKRWVCYLPPLRCRIRFTMPLVRQADFARVQPLRFAQAALIDQLDSLDLSSPSVSAGAVIFSAASYGGLISRHWLQALCRATEDDLAMGGAGIRLDLTDPRKDRKRRSFWPDPFSELLLLGHRTRHGLPLICLKDGDDIVSAMEHCLVAFCDAIGLDKGIAREVRKNLHLLALPAWFQDAPGYIVGSAIDRTPTTHLRNETLARILGESFAPITTAFSPQDADLDHSPMNVPPMVVAGRFDSYLRGIRRVLSIFGRPQMTMTSTEACTEIQSLKPSDRELRPIEKLLTDWALDLLKKAGRGEVAPSSVARYFQAIWQPLLVSTEGFDTLPLDSDSLEDLYDDALRSIASESGRRYLQGRLASFHNWLVKERKVPEINFTELDHYVVGAGTVNANLISVSEFKEAVSLLESPDIFKDEWLREVCVNVLTLCFRCGLRRREPLQLRLRDYRAGSHVLWIRPSQFGSIKSDQGIRKLFLDALLEPQELERFEKWFARMAASATNPGSSNNLILCNPDDPQKLVDPQRVFGVIMDVVRKVANDNTLVPHHLRHSFANWTFVRLQITTGSLVVPRNTPAFSDECFDLKACKRLKERLYNLLPNSEADAGRRDLYCIAALMGHLSPGTTLHSYIHLIDFLTGRFARGYPRLSRIEDIADLRGVDRSLIYRMVRNATTPDHDAFTIVLADLRNRLLLEKKEARSRKEVAM
jgi:integrase